MIYLFSGSDSFESYNKALEKAKDLAKKNNSDIKIINADELDDINIFLQEFEGVGMFSTSSIILTKRLLQNKRLTEYIIENFARTNSFEIVIWEDKKADSKLKLVKLILENDSLINFELPKTNILKSWFILECKKRGLFILPIQADFILERVEQNKWALLNEIEKLEVFAKVKKTSTFDIKDIEEVLGLTVRGDMWKFLDAVGERNKKKAIDEFKKLTTFEDNTQLLIAMITRELRILLSVFYAKENFVDLKELKLNPYVLQKAQKKTSYFTPDLLKRLFEKLFALDYAIKSGEVEEKVGLTLFLSEI